jgi:Ca2+-binding RTX toxin-like protein
MSLSLRLSSRSSDSNNSFSTAPFVGTLGTDIEISGRLGRFISLGGFFEFDSVDYFAFEVEDTRNVVISNDEEEVTVRLYDEDRRFIGRLLDDGYGADYAQDQGFEEGLAVSLSEGLYYLRVSDGDDFSDYEIELNADEDNDFRLDDARDLGTINCSRRVNGDVGELDFGDSYQFRPGRSGKFVLSLDLDGPEGEIQLYDDDEDLIEEEETRIEASLDDDRDYSVRVVAGDAAEERDYTLTLIPNPVYQGTNQPDRLVGCADDEIFRGLQADDVLIGNKGQDQLVGAAGDDRLEGGNGDDRLEGGRGFDVLIGGRGRDTFVLLGNNNSARIRDFQDGLDRLELPDSIPVNSIQIVQQSRNTVIQSENQNVLAILNNVSASQITGADFR